MGLGEELDRRIDQLGSGFKSYGPTNLERKISIDKGDSWLPPA